MNKWQPDWLKVTWLTLNFAIIILACAIVAHCK